MISLLVKRGYILDIERGDSESLKTGERNEFTIYPTGFGRSTPCLCNPEVRLCNATISNSCDDLRDFLHDIHGGNRNKTWCACVHSDIEMFVSTVCTIVVAFAATVLAIAPPDLPECTLECHLTTSEKVGLEIDDFEGHCLSALFQLGIRNCVAINCDYHEFKFVSQIADGD